MISPTIVDIIQGSYKAGYEIFWEIFFDHNINRIVVEIDGSTIEPYWYNCAQTNIERDMEQHRPEVLVRWV